MSRVRIPRTLTARLVATAVALVAVISVIIAAITTVAIHSQLMNRLDDNVLSSVRRVGDGDSDNASGTRGPQPIASNQGPDTLLAIVEPPNADQASRGVVLTEERGGKRQLSGAALARLSQVPADRKVHGVDLPGVGSYRVAGVRTDTGSILVSGLPTRDVDETLASLIGYEALLIAIGLLTAAGLGLVVVRRQLRPLREVAATAHHVADLPLASGAIDLEERVPERLTDERTEVGQMGAALNTLLAHVENSLEARHRSEQQIRQFVADASHELRTPLSTIHGYAELSRRTPEDAHTLAGAMSKVETEADRMSGLVEDLLLLARLDAGRPLERTDVDVTRLLLETVADARVVAPDHRWRLDLPDEPLTVTGDERRLHHVVTNFLNNARNHTPAGTTVSVGAAEVPSPGCAPGPDKGMVRVSVHDDGPGLPENLNDHAFERFTRGDSSRTRGSGGAGLGLSLVQAITTAHGGTVRVSSRPGDTEFVLLLPR